MRGFLLWLALGSTIARADDAPSAEDVKAAPRPGDESGRLDRDPGDGVGRSVARGLLWIPRVPFEAVMQPLRGAFYLQDRYLSGAGSGKPKRFGVAPVVLAETGFGTHVGVRANAGELAQLRVGYGGRSSLGEIGLGTGTRIRPGIVLRAEKRERERFYGIGNGDGASTRYELVTTRVAPQVRIQLPARFGVTATTAVIRDHSDGTDRGRSIETAHEGVPGFGLRHSLGSEIELAWDSRRRGHPRNPVMMRSAGALVRTFAGYSAGLDDSLDSYRGGLDAETYLHLTEGPRMITLRGRIEAVGGDPAFLELPRLGGVELLRGYATDRYRDRVATVGQAGYQFSLSRFVGVKVFADVGRVHASLDELSASDLHVGFGGSLVVVNRTSYVLRTQLAYGLDGGLFASLAIDPGER